VTEHPPEHGNVARLWAVESGRLLLELRGYGDQVTKAVFSPDGKLIATSSWDGAARIYTCLVCAPFNDLLAIARSRVSQTLTPEERARALGEQPKQVSVRLTAQ
jgi:WD40 repeat protein